MQKRFFIKENGEENIPRILISILFGIIALIFLFGSWTMVTPGQKAIIIRLGSINRILDTGVHLKFPLVESVKKIDIQVQKSEIEASAASKDLQNVSSKIALNYQIDPNKIDILYQQIGMEYDSRVLAPALQEAVKSATAKYTAEELITKREQVKNEMRQNLVERLAVNHILLTDVNIVNFEFSQSFNEAIENKVTAEQQALAAKNKLEQVKYEAEQRVVQSKAEAEAIKIQAEALKENKSLVELEAVKKWDGHLPQYMTGVTPFVNFNK